MSRFSGIPKMDTHDIAVRNAIKQAICSSSKSRECISDELSERLQRPVTVRMLDDFTAVSKGGARFPAAWVGAFCEITGSDELQRLLFTPEIQALVRLGECELLTQRQRQMKSTILAYFLSDKPESRR